MGLVIERPGHGYELARRVEQRFPGAGWNSSGVYEALNRLLAVECVRIRDGGSQPASSGRPVPPMVYESTPAGVSYIREWLLKPTKPGPMRNELDLKIQLAGPTMLPALIEQTWALEGYCMDQLKELVSKPTAAILPTSTWSEASVALQRETEIKQWQLRIECHQRARKVMAMMLARQGRR